MERRSRIKLQYWTAVWYHVWYHDGKTIDFRGGFFSNPGAFVLWVQWSESSQERPRKTRCRVQRGGKTRLVQQVQPGAMRARTLNADGSKRKPRFDTVQPLAIQVWLLGPFTGLATLSRFVLHRFLPSWTQRALLGKLECSHVLTTRQGDTTGMMSCLDKHTCDF